MAQKVVWTRSALGDLESIATYISTGSQAYASAFVEKILTISATLTKFPLRGRIVPELGHRAIREIIVWSYRVIYTTQKREVIILALIHAKRDLRQVWDK